MSDLNQILAGNVEDVIKALAPLTADQLTELKVLEEADKKRKGVLSAIATALAALVAAEALTGTDTIESATIGHEVTENVSSETAETDPVAAVEHLVLTPATNAVAAPAAPALPMTSIDISHPAVDADLRSGTTELQNRIDFNDPFQGGREAVEAALSAQIED